MCVKLLLSCYHGGYLWLDRRITVDLVLIHWINGLRMQGPNPQEFYPGKAADRALAQWIKDTYDNVEKGKRGYKVTSIQNGALHLACQLIVGKIIRKNISMHITGFVIDLTWKCIEGMKMNWVSYLVNQLEKYFSWSITPGLWVSL